MERWAHLSFIWPFKNYWDNFYSFYIIWVQSSSSGIPEINSKSPISVQLCKEYFFEIFYEFSFFVWECIAFIYYYIIGDLECFPCWCWFFSNKVFSITFLVTILVIMIIISAKLGNLRCCTRLGLLCVLHKVFFTLKNKYSVWCWSVS